MSGQYRFGDFIKGLLLGFIITIILFIVTFSLQLPMNNELPDSFVFSLPLFFERNLTMYPFLGKIKHNIAAKNERSINNLDKCSFFR